MISYHKQLVSTLNTILPTHYELVLHRGLDIPCISYMLLNDASTAKGNTLEYSRIQYQIKVWGNRIDEIENYALAIDKALRPLGWTRIGCKELHDRESAMIQKIMVYECLALEEF